jgi:hypothetical protein
MQFDIEKMTARDMCLMFPLLKQQLFKLGLLKTGHKFSDAEQELGWEVAEHLEKAENKS